MSSCQNLSQFSVIIIRTGWWWLSRWWCQDRLIIVIRTRTLTIYFFILFVIRTGALTAQCGSARSRCRSSSTFHSSCCHCHDCHCHHRHCHDCQCSYNHCHQWLQKKPQERSSSVFPAQCCPHPPPLPHGHNLPRWQGISTKLSSSSSSSPPSWSSSYATIWWTACQVTYSCF